MEKSEKLLFPLCYKCAVDQNEEEEIDEMVLLDLTETMVEQLFPKMGQGSKFLRHLKELKIEKNLSGKNSPVITQHPLIDWTNISIELSDEIEYITDNDTANDTVNCTV
ncbi:unnamed protein product [Macrosiphum euphorbiae]|uniref:Uncharacterized protein n=1 Tax=Macrosiphum euphorbiae TaxID=13131 RepID=A0AAV0Y399_9HEMI|nr:unnamed protein product [Macrosiphum euphorbiae]